MFEGSINRFAHPAGPSSQVVVVVLLLALVVALVVVIYCGYCF